MTDLQPLQIRTPWQDPPADGGAIEVAEGVLWLRLPLPMRLDHVNVYALDEGDGWTLVDTGFDTRHARKIWARLLQGPLAGRPVRRVIATHHHPDHLGLAGWFQTEHGAELAMPRLGWFMARMLLLDEEALPSPQTLAFWRALGMDPEVYARRAAERPYNFSDVVAPMPSGFTRISDGDVIEIGGRRWDVRFGHGHAPDHATFWSRDDDLVLAGDQLLPSISPNLGVHTTEQGADPVGEWLDSCARLAAFAEDRHLVLPGHKLPYRGLPLRMRQLAENHINALTRLLDHLETPRKAGECFVPIFKREIGGDQYGLALSETAAHLNHLWRRGQIRRDTDPDGAWIWRRA
ncbi:metallo-beta-lactamase [Defluviimonas sp. 20V17]|uniref:Glyoxylase, beta-lactamase superfamily II n=1 Tax=Allgaiera indica TaxID=765699 RepID=A0AAN4ZYZ1_9RHOB|nr:MBL fold metallo-hydrolase [Allgaiera indica]KDB03840.1 metallo-beta-lactamase [Defluviimonas sp. 20V17]GHE00166.1 MBL fold hydrolase [Allgaiera indica]SDW36002.1 Glyoxylase, beta-lactamase superfamily II [Allgaiera indica]